MRHINRMVYHRHFLSLEYGRNQVFEFIESWYNRKRSHSYLGYLSPEEFGLIQLLNVA
ncbi:MAG: IS3 family transposase [Cyclobacteriaceae bacterium]|nr:IS3 family transposase [Cyclobacteriaceae bacterium]